MLNLLKETTLAEEREPEEGEAGDSELADREPEDREPEETLTIPICARVHPERSNDDWLNTLLQVENPSVSRNDQAGEVYYAVRPSNRLVCERQKRYLALVFPHLFPYGRGSPDEERRTPVSLIKCIQHYLRLSTRQFQGPEFQLRAYNLHVKNEAFSRAYVTSLWNPDALENFSRITPEELRVALQYSQLRAENRQRGLAPPPLPSGIAERTTQFLRTMKAVTQTMLHTEEAALDARKSVLSYCIKFGQPSLFVTFAPDDNNNMLVLRLARSAHASAREWVTVRVSLVNTNPTAGAMAFMKLVPIPSLLFILPAFSTPNLYR